MPAKEVLKAKILKDIDNNREKIEKIGTYLYDNPELGFKELKCHKLITDLYKSLNIDFEDNLAITGTKATLIGKSSNINIALLGEMDAVYNPNHIKTAKDGASHCCGHNAQIAIMLGVFMAFFNSEIYKKLNGNITFISTPAEELLDLNYREKLIAANKIEYYSGKQNMIKDGIFDNIDLVLSSHAAANPNKFIELNVDLAGFIIKKVKFIGKPAHSGLAPHEGINALSAANLSITAINSIRETFKDTDNVRISPIIKDNTLAINVVPEKVEMESYVRASTIDAILDTGKKFDRCIKGASYAIGAKYEIENVIGYLPFYQTKEINDLIYDNSMKFINKDQIKWGEMIAASGDVGDVSTLCPTIQMGFGGFKGMLHGNDFSVADKDAAYIIPAKILACTIVDLLFDEQPLANKIRKNYTPDFKSKDEYVKLLESLKKGNDDEKS
jgi:amidohydrolase